MSGTRGRVVAAVLLVVVVVLGWYQFLYKPAANDVSDARGQLQQVRTRNSDLEAQVRRLQRNQQGSAAVQAQIARLQKLIPARPALDSFLRAAYDIKLKSGVEWVSIAPSEPTPGAGASEIKMQIVVRGGYYQVLDYLNRFEKSASMPRLVVVDGINVVTGAQSGSTGSSGSGATPTTAGGPSTGAPNLSVTLTARMFTQAGATGATGATGSTGSTTPTTPTTTGATSPTSTGASN